MSIFLSGSGFNKRWLIQNDSGTTATFTKRWKYLRDTQHRNHMTTNKQGL